MIHILRLHVPGQPTATVAIEGPENANVENLWKNFYEKNKDKIGNNFALFRQHLQEYHGFQYHIKFNLWNLTLIPEE